MLGYTAEITPTLLRDGVAQRVRLIDLVYNLI